MFLSNAFLCIASFFFSIADIFATDSADFPSLFFSSSICSSILATCAFAWFCSIDPMLVIALPTASNPSAEVRPAVFIVSKELAICNAPSPKLAASSPSGPSFLRSSKRGDIDSLIAVIFAWNEAVSLSSVVPASCTLSLKSPDVPEPDNAFISLLSAVIILCPNFATEASSFNPSNFFIMASAAFWSFSEAPNTLSFNSSSSNCNLFNSCSLFNKSKALFRSNSDCSKTSAVLSAADIWNLPDNLNSLAAFSKTLAASCSLFVAPIAAISAFSFLISFAFVRDFTAISSKELTKSTASPVPFWNASTRSSTVKPKSFKAPAGNSFSTKVFKLSKLSVFASIVPLSIIFWKPSESSSKVFSFNNAFLFLLNIFVNSWKSLPNSVAASFPLVILLVNLKYSSVIAFKEACKPFPAFIESSNIFWGSKLSKLSCSLSPTSVPAVSASNCAIDWLTSRIALEAFIASWSKPSAFAAVVPSPANRSSAGPKYVIKDWPTNTNMFPTFLTPSPSIAILWLKILTLASPEDTSLRNRFIFEPNSSTIPAVTFSVFPCSIVFTLSWSKATPAFDKLRSIPAFVLSNWESFSLTVSTVWFILSKAFDTSFTDVKKLLRNPIIIPPKNNICPNTGIAFNSADPNNFAAPPAKVKFFFALNPIPWKNERPDFLDSENPPLIFVLNLSNSWFAILNPSSDPAPPINAKLPSSPANPADASALPAKNAEDPLVLLLPSCFLWVFSIWLLRSRNSCILVLCSSEFRVPFFLAIACCLFIVLLTWFWAFSKSFDSAVFDFNFFCKAFTELNSAPLFVFAFDPLTKSIFAVCAATLPAFAASAAINFALFATCVCFSAILPRAGIIVVRIVLPNSTRPPIMAELEPAIILKNGAKTVFISLSPFRVSSSKAAESWSNWLGFTASDNAPYFLAPCSIVAFKKACRLSASVNWVALLLREAAYSVTAVSNLTRIPNSSKISGSSFATPRNNLSIESVIFLPSAIEAFLATSVSCAIWSVLNPEVTAIDAERSAVSSEMALSVTWRIPSAICKDVLPAWLPKNVKPSIRVSTCAAVRKALKAAVAAKTFAANVA